MLSTKSIIVIVVAVCLLGFLFDVFATRWLFNVGFPMLVLWYGSFIGVALILIMVLMWRMWGYSRAPRGSEQ